MCYVNIRCSNREGRVGLLDLVSKDLLANVCNVRSYKEKGLRNRVVLVNSCGGTKAHIYWGA